MSPLVPVRAALGGASDEQLDVLRAFGLPLGVAFQLRDDLLGVFGDPAVTGEPSGDDLREGKRTTLVALATRVLDARGRESLDAVLGDQAATDAAIAVAQDTIAASGAVEQVERLISAATTKALEALGSPLLAPAGVTELRELAAAVTQRVA
ncbi:polyprenyl synthetase family protein [Dietzia lutea]|uniref:Geranylgeranyl pyrophosphate synthase n=1 Tax=Dietzia lutea TaxID=546160 RepID=A0A2S1R3U3_9ACTN|nr:polyprenyl synthetase family protein [Dietzia lutea]AWH90924.1 hypothetical protein A6035_00595 [Dietzia lutea]